MKSSRIRNMRDIPTIQGLKNRTVPDSREQIMSELARLEHEKARIDREISVWAGNQKKAQIRATEVQDRIAILQGLITELVPRTSFGLRDDEEESTSGEFRAVKFEY